LFASLSINCSFTLDKAQHAVQRENGGKAAGGIVALVSINNTAVGGLAISL